VPRPNRSTCNGAFACEAEPWGVTARRQRAAQGLGLEGAEAERVLAGAAAAARWLPARLRWASPAEAARIPGAQVPAREGGALPSVRNMLHLTQRRDTCMVFPATLCHSASAPACTDFHEQHNLHDSLSNTGAQSGKPGGRATERVRWPAAAAPPAAEPPCPTAARLTRRGGPGGARLPRAAGAAAGAPAPGRARPARPARRLPGAARLPACGAARAGARALPARAPPAPRRARRWLMQALLGVRLTPARAAARRPLPCGDARRCRAAGKCVHKHASCLRPHGRRAAQPLWPAPALRCVGRIKSGVEPLAHADHARPQAAAKLCGRVRRLHSAAAGAPLKAATRCGLLRVLDIILAVSPRRQRA